jgi:hypothetical protein
MTGLIYVIRSAADLYKVGYTVNPHQRLSLLQTGSHERLALLGVIPGTRAQEAELHSLLAPWRVSGEWFRRCRALDPLLAALLPAEPIRHPLPSGASPLREYRTANGLRLEDVAARFGVAKGDVSRWERGVRKVPLMRCAAIERLTGIPRHRLRPDVFGAVN